MFRLRDRVVFLDETDLFVGTVDRVQQKIMDSKNFFTVVNNVKQGDTHIYEEKEINGYHTILVSELLTMREKLRWQVRSPDFAEVELYEIIKQQFDEISTHVPFSGREDCYKTHYFTFFGQSYEILKDYYEELINEMELADPNLSYPTFDSVLKTLISKNKCLFLFDTIENGKFVGMNFANDHNFSMCEKTRKEFKERFLKECIILGNGSYFMEDYDWLFHDAYFKAKYKHLSTTTSNGHYNVVVLDEDSGKDLKINLGKRRISMSGKEELVLSDGRVIPYLNNKTIYSTRGLSNLLSW